MHTQEKGDEKINSLYEENIQIELSGLVGGNS